jgi:hypothetical protein
VAQTCRHPAIDGRSTRHEGQALSQKRRKRIGEPFGRSLTVGGLAQTVDRGVERVRACFVLTMAANTLDPTPAAARHECRVRHRLPYRNGAEGSHTTSVLVA